jgi:hypothetical protein
MIRKLIVAALVALVAGPALALHQLSLADFETPPAALELGGARVIDLGSLLATGLI